MEKILITVTLLIAVLIAGIQFVNLVNANPTPLFPFPLEQPVRGLPKVVIHSPIQNTIYNSSTIWLNFSIIKPDGWFQSEEYRNQGYGGQFGNITSIYYFIDNKKQEISMHDVDSLCKGYPDKVLNFSVSLNLMNGNHSLKVGCDADSYYIHIIVGQEFELRNISVNSESSLINFENINQSVDTHPPEVTIISIKNEQHYIATVPVSFVVNESVLWISYSLDGQTNVTLTANITLSGLSVGSHNLTMYAQDEAGNIGCSQTSTFTVDKPESFPTVPITASIGIITIVSVSLLIYFKKHKERK